MDTSLPDNTKNSPVEEARRGLGLTRKQLALACDLSYYTVAQIERGFIIKLPWKLRRFLAGAGVDVKALELSNAIWREEQSRFYAEKLLGSYARAGAPSLSRCVSELEGLLMVLSQIDNTASGPLEE